MNICFVVKQRIEINFIFFPAPEFDLMTECYMKSVKKNPLFLA